MAALKDPSVFASRLSVVAIRPAASLLLAFRRVVKMIFTAWKTCAHRLALPERSNPMSSHDQLFDCDPSFDAYA